MKGGHHHQQIIIKWSIGKFSDCTASFRSKVTIVTYRLHSDSSAISMYSSLIAHLIILLMVKEENSFLTWTWTSDFLLFVLSNYLNLGFLTFRAIELLEPRISYFPCCIITWTSDFLLFVLSNYLNLEFFTFRAIELLEPRIFYFSCYRI